ncbi:sugar ABC transporter permease [Herbivorax sp. ANBcel31]|uniref:carbohydrate ABC transporter permease n=1 Tax=Herbivorax sp. ANBcel31 TaxID=3069754 RepID=UPI0027B36224|nr:sugar ABC transporter permease [Herbivorax sp. ANBcel31]MDQ2085483.1 sugar ABC transporter permease [Herbivorax sp. ANBcel31]
MFKNALKADKYAHWGYIFIFPFFVVMAIFLLYPIVNTLILSFTSWDGSRVPAEFVGLDNYRRLLEDIMSGGAFIRSVGNTWIMWIMNVIPQFIGALALAVLLTSKNFKGKAVFRAIFYLPNLITMASVGALFLFLLEYPGGVVNNLLLDLNVRDEPFHFLQNVWATRITVSFALTWMWFGYTMIIFMAGIKAIPEEYFEAARVDGASKWKAFVNITLPLLRPIMMYQVVTSIIGGLSMYDLPFVLTQGTGGPGGAATTMVMNVYRQAFRNYQFGYASTTAIGLFIHIFILVFIAIKILKPQEND